MSQLGERVAVLRDEVLDTAEHGDRDPPGSEVFEALLRVLTSSDSLSQPELDLGIHDAVARRLAWGDDTRAILADADRVFTRLLAALERSIGDVEEQMAVVEAATQITTALARVVALSAIAGATRDRTARLREELAQRQLRTTIDHQRRQLVRLKSIT